VEPIDAAWQHIDDLNSVQDALIEDALQGASRSQFYRQRWAGRTVGSRDDLTSLPLTTKQDLRDAYPFGMLAVPMARVATYHESSGTGGVPTASFYTERDWQDINERFARKWVGITPDDVFLVRTPYALMMTGHMAHNGARHCGATVVPGDNRSAAVPYSRVVRLLHDLGVSLSWSLPTETMMWAAAAQAAGWEPSKDFPALRALFVAGEPLSVARRQRISQIWGVPAVEDYGSTETGPLAGQCVEGSMHLWADRALFEVYDPITRELSPSGSGQLVVTMLRREAMPLVRYNLEDDVDVSYDPCACGWRLPTVRIFGRTRFAHRVGDAVVTAAGLEELVFSLPAHLGVLFWRAKADPVVLRIEVEAAPGQGEQARELLTDTVTTTLGAPVQVVATPPGGLLPTSVLTRVADLVKPRSLFGPDEDWDRALLYY
jgi:phenylacetate-CoA ligase